MSTSAAAAFGGVARQNTTPPDLLYNTLCILTPRNPLRLAVRGLITQWWFDRFIDLCIVLNCVSLALRDPMVEDECAYAQPAWANDVRCRTPHACACAEVPLLDC